MPQAAPLIPQPRQHHSGPSSPLTVLIVDDDADMRIYLKQCLGFLGERLDQVLEASDGLMALRLARHVSVDLIITDIVMPHMDGYALCKALKTETLLRSIQVVVISGEDEHGTEMHSGADAFLRKPFNAARFRACLERLLPQRPSDETS